MELIIHFTALPEKLTLDMVKSDLAELLEDDGWLTGSGADYLELELEDGLPDVHHHRERTVQVMMNIVSNSIKYTPDGGKIVISAGRTGDRVWMQVDDNGIGIPPEDRPRIFERFYRVDKARSREVGGTGLGLSIVSDTVRRRGGTVSVAHRPAGQGTLFTVRLPQVTEEGGSA